MNRQQLVDAVGERLGDRKAAAVAVEAVLDTVTGALAEGERVSIFGFGVFEKVDRAARTARNPATGGTVDVPATSVPRFRPGQALKDAVGGRSGADRGPRTTSGADQAPAEPTPKPARSEPAKDDGKKAKADGKDKPRAGSKKTTSDGKKKTSDGKKKGKGSK